MLSDENCLSLPLPRGWKDSVKSSVIHAISLAHYALTYARSWAVNSPIQRVRLKAQLQRAKNEVALLKEEIRVKDSRMMRIKPHHRPRYAPEERMAIMEVKAARNLSIAQAARMFLVGQATIASWMKRLNEQGPYALLQAREPINKFPELVKYLVKRLKVLCPTMGKVKIARILTRAGLHLAASTVGRMLKHEDKEIKPIYVVDIIVEEKNKKCIVTAKYPNHVWHIDLTTIPTSDGFWVPWLPQSLPQSWPFCWWIAVIIDHYSRRVMGFALFKQQPTSLQVRQFLGRALSRIGKKPKHIICDQGSQFIDKDFKKWCRNKIGRKPRYGAIGKHGSIAVIERFIRTMKDEYLRRILIPLRMDRMRKKLTGYINWYNEHRPHSTLNGATPLEIYEGVTPANLKPRYEPRPHWPVDSPCAAPQVEIKVERGIRLKLVVTFLDKDRQLPVVDLQEVA